MIHLTPSRNVTADYALFMIACICWLSYNIVSRPFYRIFYESGTFLNGSNIIILTLSLVVASELWKMAKGFGTVRDSLAALMLAVMCAGPAARGSDSLLINAVLIWCSRSYDTRRVVGTCTQVLTACTLAVVASSAVGLIADTVIYQSNAERVRHCLGFTYALVPSQLFFCITCSLCYVRDRLRASEALALVLLNVLGLVLTDSRQSSLLAVALVLAVWVGGSYRKLGHAILRLGGQLSWSFTAATVLSFALTLAFGLWDGPGHRLLAWINEMFGYRLGYGFIGLREYGMTLLGQELQTNGNGLNVYGQRNIGATQDYYYVDNLFVKTFISEGLFFFLGFVALLTMVSRKAYHDRDLGLLLALTVTAAHCIVDDLSGSLSNNLLLFAIGGLGVYRSREEAPKTLLCEGRTPRVAGTGHARIGNFWRLGGAMVGSLVLVLFLVALGLLGTTPADPSRDVGTTLIRDVDGSRLLHLRLDDSGEAIITYRGTRLRGSMDLKRSNNQTETYELSDLSYPDGRDPGNSGIAISLPHARQGDGVIGRWLVCYYDAQAGQYLSDWIEVNADGTALVNSGQYNAMARGDDAMREGAALFRWDSEDGQTRIQLY